MKLNFYAIVWLTAIILAISSAFYSVFGLSQLFSGAVIAIIVVASILESSKIVVATYIHDYWNKMSIILKSYMVFALICLMAITSLGVYGFLTSAYQDTIKDFKLNQSAIQKVEIKIKTFETQSVLLKEKEAGLQAQLQNIQTLKANQDKTISTIYSNTKSKSTKLLEKAMQSTNTSYENVYTQITSIQQKNDLLLDSITYYQTKKLELEMNNQVSEVGPLLYISKALSVEMDTVVNYLVLLIMIVFDPLAVALVFAANSIKSKNKFENTEKNDILKETEPDYNFESTENTIEEGLTELNNQENVDFIGDVENNNIQEITNKEEDQDIELNDSTDLYGEPSITKRFTRKVKIT